MSLHESLKLECRFVVEDDCIQIGRRETRSSQTEAKRIDRETLVVLHAREALLLRGGSHCAINYESRSSIVVVRRDAENSHALLTLVLVSQRTFVNCTWCDDALARDVQ